MDDSESWNVAFGWLATLTVAQRGSDATLPRVTVKYVLARCISPSNLFAKDVTSDSFGNEAMSFRLPAYHEPYPRR